MNMNKVTLKEAFKYPFNRAKGMWNILWIFVPFIGFLILSGYTIRIVQEFSKGKFKQLPIFNFNKALELGFFMWLKSIPFSLVYFIVIFVLTLITPWFRVLNLLLSLFILPVLYVHFMNKETVTSLFEFKIVKPVFIHFGDYVLTLLKSMLVGLVFFIMIIVLVGLPAGAFTKSIFIADFYRRRVKT